jgi:hypothetical protein
LDKLTFREQAIIIFACSLCFKTSSHPFPGDERLKTLTIISLPSSPLEKWPDKITDLNSFPQGEAYRKNQAGMMAKRGYKKDK